MSAPKREFYTVTFDKVVFNMDKRYQNLQPVGTGAYGIVCMADDTYTGTKVAIKTIIKMFEDLIDAKRIVREVKILVHLGKHPNVVSIIDLFTYPYNTVNFEDLYIIMDCYECDLDRVLSSDQELTEGHMKFMMYQILLGVKYCHSANILHRDLKPANILLNSDCKSAICDFGLARGVDEENPTQDLAMTSYVVTRWYRAPEIILECNNYGKAVDIWSCGCVLAEIIRRRPFLRGRDYLHQLKLIFRVIGKPSKADMDSLDNDKARKIIEEMEVEIPLPFEEYFPECDPNGIDLIKKMLVFDPHRRISIDEALGHPYLSLFRDKSKEITCDTPFNYSFESGYKEGTIPKDKLQSILYKDVLYFGDKYAEVVRKRYK